MTTVLLLVTLLGLPVQVKLGKVELLSPTGRSIRADLELTDDGIVLQDSNTGPYAEIEFEAIQSLVHYERDRGGLLRKSKDHWLAIAYGDSSEQIVLGLGREAERTIDTIAEKTGKKVRKMVWRGRGQGGFGPRR